MSAEFLLAVSGVALVMIGAATTLVASNAIKRAGGLLVSGFGAIGFLAATGAGSAPLIICVALLFVYAVFGAALVVRLQESYGSIEAAEIDAADADSDAQGRPS